MALTAAQARLPPAAGLLVLAAPQHHHIQVVYFIRCISSRENTHEMYQKRFSVI